MPAKNTYKCKFCLQNYSGLYEIRKHRNNQKGIAKKTSNLDINIVLEDIDDAKFKAKKISCNLFIVDSAPEKELMFLI